jgi:hypothetical protein
MIDKEKVFRFLKVQSQVNKEIDEFGKTSSELADYLDQLGNDLNENEIEFLVEFVSQFK